MLLTPFLFEAITDGCIPATRETSYRIECSEIDTAIFVQTVFNMHVSHLTENQVTRTGTGAEADDVVQCAFEHQ